MVTKASTSAVTKLDDFFVGVEVGGDALIQNCFNQKAVEEMLRKHMGFEVKRAPKKPRSGNSIHRNRGSVNLLIVLGNLASGARPSDRTSVPSSRM